MRILVAATLCAGVSATAMAEPCGALINDCIALAPAHCVEEDLQSADAVCKEGQQRLRLCLAEVVDSCGPGLDSPAGQGASFADSVFFGPDDKGFEENRLCFERSGIVDYESYTGNWRTGEWIRVGQSVIVSMNRGYAVYVGALADDRLDFYAINKTGLRWRIDLTRELNPPASSPSAASCRPGVVS